MAMFPVHTVWLADAKENTHYRGCTCVRGVAFLFQARSSHGLVGFLEDADFTQRAV
jgi:hypothetical protein